MSDWLSGSRLCASPMQQDFNGPSSSPTLSLSQYSEASNDSSSSHGSVASSATSLSSSSISWRDEFDGLSSGAQFAKADAAYFARQRTQPDYLKTCLNTSPRCEDSWPADFLAKRSLTSQNERHHPRRSGFCANRVKPNLIRQSDRRENFVEYLVDTATLMVAVIWPNSKEPVSPGANEPKNQVLPLRMFIKETLRRSRTSYSTLQVAMYYLILIKSKANLPRCDFTTEQLEDSPSFRAMQCGRRMFLAALILASKYLQDRNYSARAWSRISGLKIHEINSNEMAFLAAVEWKLHISEETFLRWNDIVTAYTNSMHNFAPRAGLTGTVSNSWTALVKRLTPALEFKQTTWARSPSVYVPISHPSMEIDSPPQPNQVRGNPMEPPTRPSLANICQHETQIYNPPPTPQLNSHLTTPMMSPRSRSSTPAESCLSAGAMRPPPRRMQSDAQLPSCGFAVKTPYACTSPKAKGVDDAALSATKPLANIYSGFTASLGPQSSNEASDKGINSLLEAAMELGWPTSSPTSFQPDHYLPPSTEGGLLSPPSTVDSSASDADPLAHTGANQPTSTCAFSIPIRCNKRRHHPSVDHSPARAPPEPRAACPVSRLQRHVRAALRACPHDADGSVLPDPHRAKSFLLGAPDAGAARLKLRREHVLERGFSRKRACCA